MEVILVVVLVGAFVTAVAIARGFVLTYLWAWFVVPFGAPAIGVAWAIGISLIVGYLTRDTDTSGDEENSFWTKLLSAVLTPFLVLGIGAIIHAFM